MVDINVLLSVMFKFACDWMNLYGGDAMAMKAGGHEVIGFFPSRLLCF